MQCPNCGFSPLTRDDNFCPRCGRPMDVRTRVDIRQDVTTNRGRIVGVETGVINGDVYGGDIYQVQVYALTAAGRAADGTQILDPAVGPYRYLSPFTARERALFFGRQAEIDLLTEQLGEGRLVVLYGEPGVGKTSLLAAGVIPALTTLGALVLHVRDYAQPLEQTLRAALHAAHEQVGVAVPEATDLPDLLQAICTGAQGTVVLVFDQFEQFLRGSIDPSAQAARINAVAESLQRIEPEYLRVVVSIRDDALVRLADLQEALPDLFRAFVKLEPLRYAQAEAAILQPLERVNRPIYFDERLVQDTLLPELDALSPTEPGAIQPQHLQIVCQQLYQSVLDRRPPIVTLDIYRRELRGAEGILARYLDETLDTQIADHRALAEQLLLAMAAPSAGPWVSPDQLKVTSVPSTEVRQILERLAAADLLTRREQDGQFVYGFSSHTLLQDMRRRAGPEQERRFNAADELKRVWDSWLARNAVPGPDLLAYFEENRTYLHTAGQVTEATRILLLLRATAQQHAPMGTWRAQLETESSRTLIHALEWQPAPAWIIEQPVAPSANVDEAARLLGLYDLEPPADARESLPFGPLAWAAVTHQTPAIRQTNAVALTVVDHYQAVDRLNWALKHTDKGLRRRWREAELRGAMADADPTLATLNGELSLPTRGLVWLWRFWARVRQDPIRLVMLIMAAAFGAGLLLGLLRFTLAVLLSLRPAGAFFAIYFWWGALLVAFTTAGTVAASIRPRWQATGTDAAEGDVRNLMVSIAATACFFLSGVFVITWFNSDNVLLLVLEPLRPLIALVVGAVFGWALFGHDRANPTANLLRRVFGVHSLLRLVAVALVFVLAEGAFILLVGGPLLPVVFGTGSYRSGLADWLPAVLESGSQLPTYFALADAGLSGFLLVLGAVMGLEVTSSVRLGFSTGRNGNKEGNTDENG